MTWIADQTHLLSLQEKEKLTNKFCAEENVYN